MELLAAHEVDQPKVLVAVPAGTRPVTLFQTERGRECLTEHRRELCRMRWSEWSPGWQFDEATFARCAAAFKHPDFVEVVIHDYR